MYLLNPLEILGLDDQPLADIDKDAIRRAKRRLFNRIDLDGEAALVHRARAYNRHDFEQAIIELEQPNRLRGYHDLLLYPVLGAFVAGEGLEGAVEREALADHDLMAMLVPVLRQAIGAAWLEALQQHNSSQAQRLRQFDEESTGISAAALYRPAYLYMSSNIQEAENLLDHLEDQRMSSSYKDMGLLKEKFGKSLMKALPTFFDDLKIRLGRHLLQMADRAPRQHLDLAIQFCQHGLDIVPDSEERRSLEDMMRNLRREEILRRTQKEVPNPHPEFFNRPAAPPAQTDWSELVTLLRIAMFLVIGGMALSRMASPDRPSTITNYKAYRYNGQGYTDGIGSGSGASAEARELQERLEGIDKGGRGMGQGSVPPPKVQRLSEELRIELDLPPLPKAPEAAEEPLAAQDSPPPPVEAPAKVPQPAMLHPHGHAPLICFPPRPHSKGVLRTLAIQGDAKYDAVVFLYNDDRYVAQVYVAAGQAFTWTAYLPGKNLSTLIAFGLDWDASLLNPCGDYGWFADQTAYGGFGSYATSPFPMNFDDDVTGFGLERRKLLKSREITADSFLDLLNSYR